MRFLVLISAAFSLSAIPVHSLDVSGTVFDKVFRPLPGAIVCLQADPGVCATSGIDGGFQIRSGITALFGQKNGRSAGFVSRHDMFPWKPLAIEGERWERFSGDGRSMPGGRLASVNWQATFLNRFLPGDPGKANASVVSAFAKAAAPSGLSVSKPGYAPAVYQPSSDMETGVLIVLGGVGEKVSLLFNGKNLDGWLPSSGKTIGGAAGSWSVQGGSLHSEGTVRGVLVPKEDYADFRLIFSVRHLKTDAGKPDHYPCFLLWGMPRNALPDDALGAIQFEPPTDLFWDYRPGKKNPSPNFTKVGAKLDEYQWSQCEIFADAAASQARLACCAEIGPGPCKAHEIVQWKEAGWAKTSPWGFQVHNAGLHDEYKNISIETDPVVRDLITTK